MLDASFLLNQEFLSTANVRTKMVQAVKKVEEIHDRLAKKGVAKSDYSIECDTTKNGLYIRFYPVFKHSAHV